MTSFIAATQTAFPPHYYSQEQLMQGFLQLLGEGEYSPRVVERLHQSVQVKGRHLALPLDTYPTLHTFRDRNNAWIECALSLGQECVTKLLANADIDAKEISQLIFTTVTGIAVPSIDARLMNRIGFSKSLKRVPLFGLGCVAGAAALSRGADYLAGHPDEAIVILSIELCSLTIQRQDISMANLVASGLFGDGSAAVLMVGAKHRLAQEGSPRVIANRSSLFPGSEYVMGWDIGDNGFRVILSTDVPKVAEEILPIALNKFLHDQGLEMRDIDVWISHPGGPKVINALEKGLGLSEGTLDLSRESLAQIGNLSSASVLAILEKTLQTRKPTKGTLGVLLAMGPGFCAEMVLLQW